MLEASLECDNYCIKRDYGSASVFLQAYTKLFWYCSAFWQCKKQRGVHKNTEIWHMPRHLQGYSSVSTVHTWWWHPSEANCSAVIQALSKKTVDDTLTPYNDQFDERIISFFSKGLSEVTENNSAGDGSLPALIQFFSGFRCYSIKSCFVIPIRKQALKNFFSKPALAMKKK